MSNLFRTHKGEHQRKIAGIVSWCWMQKNGEFKRREICVASWVPHTWVDRGEIIAESLAVKKLLEKAHSRCPGSKTHGGDVSEMWVC